MFPSSRGRYITLERCGIPRRISQRHEGSPSSPSLSHEGIALSLVVDFEAASKPSQSLSGANPQPGCFRTFLPHLGFPRNLESRNLDVYKGEQDSAWSDYRSGPPLTIPQGDLSLSGGGGRSGAFGACKNGVRERELKNRYYVMPN